MSIIPTWPIAAGALVIGLAGGAYVDHKIMQGRIDKITIAHTEELRLREVKRAEDEKKARDKENEWTTKVGQAEQGKQDAIRTANLTADALRDRLREQANRKPTSTGGVPTPATTCQDSAGPTLSERTGSDLVQLAQRADEMRAALGACYKAYDSLR